MLFAETLRSNRVKGNLKIVMEFINSLFAENDNTEHCNLQHSLRS